MPTLQTRTAIAVVPVDDHVTELRKAAIRVRPKVGPNMSAMLGEWLAKTKGKA